MRKFGFRLDTAPTKRKAICDLISRLFCTVNNLCQTLHSEVAVAIGTNGRTPGAVRKTDFPFWERQAREKQRSGLATAHFPKQVQNERHGIVCSCFLLHLPHNQGCPCEVRHQAGLVEM